MAEALSSAVQEALAAGRGRLNAMFAAARRGAALDPGEFRAWMRDGIAPVVDAAAAHRPSCAAAVLEALFELSLGLMAQRVLGAGARDPEVSDGWRRLLPALPALVADEPGGLAAAVVNALHRLKATPGARPEQWIAAMLRAGPRCADLPAFCDAGLVAAWRAGLAQCRLRALELGRSLDRGVAAAALGLESAAAADLAGLLAAAARDPWRSLEEAREGPWGASRLALVGRVGAFRGFGGLFPVPPRVEACDGALYARSGSGCWRLFADCYGAVFSPSEPVPAPPRQAGGAESGIDAAGNVRHLGLTESFEELAGPTSVVSDGVTLAVTVATSHKVFLVARR